MVSGVEEETRGWAALDAVGGSTGWGGGVGRHTYPQKKKTGALQLFHLAPDPPGPHLDMTGGWATEWHGGVWLQVRQCPQTFRKMALTSPVVWVQVSRTPAADADTLTLTSCQQPPPRLRETCFCSPFP